MKPIPPISAEHGVRVDQGNRLHPSASVPAAHPDRLKRQAKDAKGDVHRDVKDAKGDVKRGKKDARKDVKRDLKH